MRQRHGEDRVVQTDLVHHQVYGQHKHKARDDNAGYVVGIQEIVHPALAYDDPGDCKAAEHGNDEADGNGDYHLKAGIAEHLQKRDLLKCADIVAPHDLFGKAQRVQENFAVGFQ